jgi:TolA-binding protein
MRVASYYPDRPEAAPEALYLAGRANEALGNRAAARASYATAARVWGDDEHAAKAQAALKALSGG